MGRYLVRGEDAITPSSFTVDLNTIAAAVANGKGPYMAAIEAWVDTADAGATAWSIDLQYDDPTGATVNVGEVLGFSRTLPLNVSTSHIAVPAFPFSRLSATSLYRLVGSLVGGAGVSKVSYRIWLIPESPGDLAGF